MKTSRTTFEGRIRTALLDVLHAQWREFGVPFRGSAPTGALETVDPEALLWCSLEFTATEPRLREGVQSWFVANRTKINRQRLNTFARRAGADPRSPLWRALDVTPPTAASATRKKGKALGNRATGASTLLLRARDVLGNDCRSFLLVQLIGNPRGVRLRDVASATGYSYRSISEAATGWQRAGVVRITHGYCVLMNAAPWCELLGCKATSVTIVDWNATYEATLELLRTVTKSNALGFAADHPLVISACNSAALALESVSGGAGHAQAPALGHLQLAIASTRAHA